MRYILLRAFIMKNSLSEEPPPLQTHNTYGVRFFVFAAVFCAFLCVASAAQAADQPPDSEQNETPPARVISSFISAETIGRGVTLSTPRGGFRLGIPPGSLDQKDETRVVLRRLKKKKVKLGKRKLKSRIFAYKIKHPDGTSLHGPLWTEVKVRGKVHPNLVLRKYNYKKKKWKTIESAVDIDAGKVRAQLNSNVAILAIFKKPKSNTKAEYSGEASWFKWHGAAMNVYPIGTKVIVTDPHTGVSAKTTIVTRGPFVPGRIIDLPSHVFTKFAPLSQGVVNVEVRRAP